MEKEGRVDGGKGRRIREGKWKGRTVKGSKGGRKWERERREGKWKREGKGKGKGRGKGK